MCLEKDFFFLFYIFFKGIWRGKKIHLLRCEWAEANPCRCQVTVKVQPILKAYHLFSPSLKTSHTPTVHTGGGKRILIHDCGNGSKKKEKKKRLNMCNSKNICLIICKMSCLQYSESAVSQWVSITMHWKGQRGPRLHIQIKCRRSEVRQFLIPYEFINYMT